MNDLLRTIDLSLFCTMVTESHLLMRFSLANFFFLVCANAAFCRVFSAACSEYFIARMQGEFARCAAGSLFEQFWHNCGLV